MRITGSHHLDASRQQVWDALQDPAVLARTLPGCRSLEVTGDGAYAATVTAGVGSISGTYRGAVELRDQQPPGSYRLTAAGSGTPGTIQADVEVVLDDDGDGTVVRYEADAIVGGMIGGVGQRMLVGVAQRTAADFFAAVEHDLRHGPAAEPLPADGQVPTGPAIGEVFRPEPGAPSGRRPADLLLGAIVGALIALAGVVLGRRLARERH